MFYIIEKLRGVPYNVEGGLHFGKDDVYDYYVVACKTPKVKCYYNSCNVTDSWRELAQPYSVDDFVNQVQKISKRDKFEFTSKSF